MEKSRRLFMVLFYSMPMTIVPNWPLDADVQMQLEDIMNHKGSGEEKMSRLLLKSLGIDYDILTPEEFVTQINILKKSTHLRSYNNQRGKGGLDPTHGKGNRKKYK